MPDALLVDRGSPLYAPLERLADQARCVFMAGLPGTGKSLLIHQLAHLAHARGRRLSLLQWDIVRPVFEAGAPGQRYPQLRGVTHAVIRMAAGRWARQAVAQWHARHPDAEHLLVGEAPLVGHRFIELTRPADDEAEPLLAGESTGFVIPAPSRAVREHLEAERERRARHPLHPREQEDAPPEVLRDLWRQLMGVARALRLLDDVPPADTELAYDPAIYARVYAHVLRHRHTQVLALDTVLPTGAFSAYAFSAPSTEVLPGDAEAARFIGQVEKAYPDLAALEREVAHWYRTAGPDSPGAEGEGRRP